MDGSDILSFYKEDLEGDTSSYIHARAHVANMSPYDVLQDVINETVSAAEWVHHVLGEGPAKDAWKSFEAGYIHCHLNDPRYRLMTSSRSRLSTQMDYKTCDCSTYWIQNMREG